MQWLVDLVWAMVMAKAKGMILLWSGSVATIPTGWHLCDGTAGTVDLRDKFPFAAGGTYNPGATGGSSSHTHTATTDGHTHGGAQFPVVPPFEAGSGAIISTNTDTLTTNVKNHG